MAATLEELLTVPTSDENLAAYLTQATAAGFPATSWQSGSVPRTLLEIEATTHAALRESIREIASGGLLDLATGGWLTLLAASQFDLARTAAVKTQGLATLTAAAGAGPYTITARTLWISDASDRRYTNATGGTLSTGGTLQLTWEAEYGGAAYNVANGAITTMVTPLAGVTVANPNPGTGSWITQSGADEEADAALRSRCRNRWALLGTGSTVDAYTYWALAGSNEVRRVSVREHDNLGVTADGHVSVIMAGSTGGVSGAAVTAVTSYIAARRPLCATVHVASATTKAVTVSGTATVAIAFSAAAKAAVSTNLTSLASEIAIGGTVYKSAVIEAVMAAPGMVNYAPTLPAGDTALAYNEVVQFTDSLTWAEV